MQELTDKKRSRLREGIIIPAHPLALRQNRTLDERRQRALTRYYLAAKAGGIAVGVHTTQFAIRDAGVGLLAPVLELATSVVSEQGAEASCIKVAGIVGPTAQAVREAELAAGLGYDLGLLSMGGLTDYSDEQLLQRVRAVASVLPVFAFYLQTAVGGRPLSYTFWRQLADIAGVEAIKIAPFDRYQTLSVIRAVCASDRRDEIALYTGNDDNIVADWMTPFSFMAQGKPVQKRIVGGLLGQFAVWTKRAVELHKGVQATISKDSTPVVAADTWTEQTNWLRMGSELTACNAAIFDVDHGFRGCIPGIHEVLRRQGLLEGTYCLDPHEMLSAGQSAEIDRVCADYPHLQDDEFVREHLDDWLK